jgi:peptide chain release factor 1
LRIDFYAASGHGGQHVNRTYSAVRIVHIPSGIISTCQDEKSQHKNKDKAMKVLMARLLKMKEEESNKALESVRKSQVKSAEDPKKSDNNFSRQGYRYSNRLNII